MLLQVCRIFTAPFARAAGLLLLVSLAFVPASALAHPQLEQGKRLFSELELDAALVAFQAAIDSGELTRAELVELLSERALVLHALHRREELIADFVWLSALAPERILDMRAPPALVAMWTSVRDQGRGVLGVRLEHEANASALKLRAEFTGTVPEGARARIGLRLPGEEWNFVDAGEHRLSVTQAAEYEVFAEALGFGELVVASDGTREAPKLIFFDPLAQAEAEVDAEVRKRRRKRWGISSAAVLIVAGAAVGAYFFARKADDGPAPSEVTPVVMF